MIAITGGSGFLGKNLIQLLENIGLEFKLITREGLNSEVRLDSNITCVIHLAGKAHDINNVINFEEYYQINTELTKKLFTAFINSNAKIFIFISSIKAVSDSPSNDVSEDDIPNPQTHYGKSKLLAENFITSIPVSEEKKIYILRPSMIHGKGNRGNLNLLYKVIMKGIPWPLGAFKNKRSYCSIDNILFIIKELLESKEIPSGIYNVADDEPLSTNELITLIGKSNNIQPQIYSIPKIFIMALAKVGDLIYFPLNSERLKKLTESYIVDNSKIKKAINKPLPVSSRDGLIKTFKSFYNYEI